MISWATCESDFAPEGSTRDIYIRSTNPADWNVLLDVVRGLPHRFSIGGIETQLPETITDEFFDYSDGRSKLLSINANGVDIRCHFFEPYNIELDIDPTEVCDQHSLDGIVDLMRLIGDALGRDTLLCFVDGWRRPIIRYCPANKAFEYRPE